MRNYMFMEENVVKIEKLPGAINSGFIELNPIIDTEADKIYFGRKQHPDNMGGDQDFEDIWVAEYDALNDRWTEPKNTLENLNNEGPNFMCAIAWNDDKRIALLGNVYGKNGKMMNGLSYTENKEDAWEKPEKMKIKEFYTLSDKVDYTISSDFKVIVMSINRADTYGGRDLYVIFQESEGKWSAPVNMGNVLNSEFEDASPFISPDNRFLYFSSRGQDVNYGGSDIFVSVRQDSTWTNWSQPTNLGSMINSKYDEEYFHLPAKGDYAYFTRGVSDKDMDIYRVKIRDLNNMDALASK